MRVEAADLEARRLTALDCGRQRRQRNPEFRVLLPGRDLLVGVGPDPGRHPQEDALATTGGELLEAVDLVEGVDDHVPDAGIESLLQLGLGLVVAVHVDPLRLEPAAERQVQLATGGDVAGEPLLGEQPVGGGAAQRLARVEDLEALGPLGEGGDDLAGAGAEVILGIDISGGAEFGRELDQVAAADLDPAALVDAAPGGEDRRPRDRVGERAGVSGIRAHHRRAL